MFRGVILTLTALLLLSSSALSQDKIKIGISSALTGEAANYGLDIKDAVLFAKQQLNADNFEFIFEDDKCSGKEAVSIAKKFVEIDKVDYVIGYACSGAALAAAPIYEKAKTPVIITCASSPRIEDAGEYIFRTFPSDKHAALRLYQHIKSKHKHFGMLFEETEYAQAMAEAFTEANKSKALKITEESYLPKTTNFRTIILRLQKTGLDGLFVNSQSEGTSAIILKQIRELGWDVPVYGAYWPGSPAYLEIAGDLAEGVEFVDTPSFKDILTKEGSKILDRFYKSYPKIRSIDAVWATSFEAVRIVQQLSKTADPRHIIHKTKYSGLVGNYYFDRKGEVQGIDFVMKTIKDGRPVRLNTED